MNTFSKKTLRILGLASIALALTVGFSCNKDKTDPKPSDNSDPNGETVQHLMASADINFVDDGETFNFKCYELEDKTPEIFITTNNDAGLYLIFKSRDKYGNDIDKPDIAILIKTENDFHQGDVYTIPDSLAAYMNVTIPNGSLYTAQSSINLGSGEMKITSISANHIKGTFEFTGYTTNGPVKKVIISNGKFDCKLTIEEKW